MLLIDSIQALRVSTRRCIPGAETKIKKEPKVGRRGIWVRRRRARGNRRRDVRGKARPTDKRAAEELAEDEGKRGTKSVGGPVVPNAPPPPPRSLRPKRTGVASRRNTQILATFSFSSRRAISLSYFERQTRHERRTWRTLAGNEMPTGLTEWLIRDFDFHTHNTWSWT